MPRRDGSRFRSYENEREHSNTTFGVIPRNVKAKGQDPLGSGESARILCRNVIVFWPVNRSQVAIGLIGLISAISALQAAAADSDPDKNPRFAKLVAEADQLAIKKESRAAIARCDEVIAAFKTYYQKEKRKIYCGNTSTEVLRNLLEALARKESAIVLSPTWANAYFVKGYALQDLRRLPEAKSAIITAVGLSPANSHYLNELGEIYELEKNWTKAKQAFTEAEDNAALSPEETRADDLARARRGLGYVYVELGQLADAERKYRQCLATNPNDSRARAELQYIQQLRAKQRK
jgi:tetratricopeptide (TPR) repeat protein